MTEDEFIVLILGGVLVGLLFGIITRLLAWPPLVTALGTAGGYIGLSYVIGYAISGLPETLAKLVAGALLVLPGFVGFIGFPLCCGFALSYRLTPVPARNDEG
jgi:ribose/xylose/arabinose/galactoside ABC-type transport system permease subunit